MDKMFIRKDVYEELLEKGFGKKDYSKLTKKVITDKNGHKRTVFVKNDVEQTEQKQPKAQEGLTPEKKARYEEMLEKVKAGSDENALFVRGKGMLNKKDAIAHLSEKLGMKVSNQSAEDFLHGSEPTPGKIMKNQQQQIMAENDNKVVIKRKYGMISLYGAKTGDHIADFPTEKARLDFMKENNLSKPDANTTSPDIKGGEKTVDRYKELYENKKKTTQDDMKTKKKSSKELKKEIEDLRSEYREKYDSLSEKEKNEYVKKFDELEAEIDKAETEETGMNKFERRGYEGTIENKWLDKSKLPQIKENAEAKIKGYENLLNDLKNDKTKKNSVQRESYEVNLAIAQDNLDEWKGKLKAINEMMEKASKKNTSETKDSVNGFTLDDISHIGDGKTRDQTKFINDMETAKGVVEMIAKKYGATKKGREQLMDFIALNIGGSNPLYDKLYEEYGIDADDLDMDFEASHDLILNQAMGKDTQKNREQIADSKSDFERRYRQMLESED